MSINFNELRELLGAIAHTDIAEVSLKTETFELTVRRDITTTAIQSPTATTPEVLVPPSVAPTATPPPEPVPSPADKEWVAITSPMVGTFYRGGDGNRCYQRGTSGIWSNPNVGES